MLAMGLVSSWWAVLAVPAALLIGFAFGGVCMALTTFMRSWQDFEYVTLAMRADVPVLGDVLPGHGLPGGSCAGSSRPPRSTAASCSAAS